MTRPYTHKTPNLHPVFIATDHGGYELKEILKQHFPFLQDLGTHSSTSVDYPDFAASLCQKLIDSSFKDAYGILICGTGIGVSITANRFSGIRAALCHDVTSTRLSRLHNDANVLCLGARVIGPAVAKDCVDTFLTTDFEGGRHQRRIDKIEAACDSKTQRNHNP